MQRLRVPSYATADGAGLSVKQQSATVHAVDIFAAPVEFR